MASTYNTLSSPDISDVMNLLNAMKKQNEEILAKLNCIEDDNRKLREELLDMKSYYDYQKHNVKASSRKRNEPEDEDEVEDQNEPSNFNKRARVSVASVDQPEAEPGHILDPPASFDTLDDDCLGNVLDFVGKKCYSSFGCVNKRCHEMFCSEGLPKETYLYGYGPLNIIQLFDSKFIDDDLLSGLSKGVLNYNRRDIFEWMLTDESDDCYNRLKYLCDDAIKESRLDILREVFERANESQLEDLRDCDEDPDLCWIAAQFGKLECMKLLRENECEWDKFTWRKAKQRGHEHILQYMRNNGYPTEWQIDRNNEVN